MCIYTYVYVCIHIYLYCVYIYVNVCKYTGVYVYIYIDIYYHWYMYLYIYIYTYTYIYIYIYICIHLYTYVYIYIYIYIHVYIYIIILHAYTLPTKRNSGHIFNQSPISGFSTNTFPSRSREVEVVCVQPPLADLTGSQIWRHGKCVLEKKHSCGLNNNKPHQIINYEPQER